MKKILFITLFALPFLAFSQEISGTAWKIHEDDGDRKVIFFEADETFTYLQAVSKSGNAGVVFGDDDEIWGLHGNKLEGYKLVVLFNDGYKIMTGTLNRTGDYMSGTVMNKDGYSGTWFGELIKF